LEKKLYNKIYRFATRLSHTLKVRKIDIKGIQSPYVYNFVCNITKNLWPYYNFNIVESARIEILDDLSKIPDKIKMNEIFSDYLSDIKIGSRDEVIAGQTIFRIINYIQAKTILEIGTLFGIDTLYMAEANLMADCTILADNPQMAVFAKRTMDRCKMPKIKILAEDHVTDLLKTLKSLETVDFVLFNASADFLQKLEDITSCMSAVHPGTVFVIKYIHNSPEMERIWETVRNHPKVSASIEMFPIGILFFRQDLEKKNYLIRPKYKYYEHLH